MKLRALEISEINSYMKKVISSDPLLYNIRVKGEISNFRPNKSGHVYLTLKDENSKLKCVIFSSDYDRKMELEDGMKITASGRISVYEKDGSYQLYIKKIEKEGIGDLHAEFEKLKKKLYKEGLFDDRFKKPIPKMPHNIGVVTSETGAVIRDIINVVKRRYPKIGIKLYPVSVQGDKSAAEIVKGIEFFNRMKNVDTIIVGRGGGSIEELWSFNEEVVARAVFASEIPIISAVGHEIDYTICDFVSDMRAPTPSAAAEIATPSMDELIYRLDNSGKKLSDEIGTIIKFNKSNIENMKKRIISGVKDGVIYHSRSELDNISGKIRMSVSSKLDIERHKSNDISEKINTAINQNIIREKKNKTDNIYSELVSTVENYIDYKKTKLEKTGSVFHSLSPLATMDRGFSIVKKDGDNINSVEDIVRGDRISVIMKDGEADCTVESVSLNREVK